jgi:hypothetical protein
MVDGTLELHLRQHGGRESKTKLNLLMRRVAQGLRDCGKFGGKDVHRFRCGAAQLPCGGSGDSTTRYVGRLRGRVRNRVPVNAATVLGASHQLDHTPFCAFSGQTRQFFALNAEHQFDRCNQIFETLSFRTALAVCAGDFRTKCREPFPIGLNDCGVASFHSEKIPRPVFSGNPVDSFPSTIIL